MLILYDLVIRHSGCAAIGCLGVPHGVWTDIKLRWQVHPLVAPWRQGIGVILVDVIIKHLSAKVDHLVVQTPIGYHRGEEQSREIHP